ncbi:MAG: acyltransferase [Methylococcales bacterium]
MRNQQIDLLRFIGLAMIILAHVEPPNIIFQLRNFDVPLMVLVSGMSFGLAFKRESYLQYVWKRIKRLIFPVWIFLTVYFFILFVFKSSLEDLSYHTIFDSYFFIDGIGYVWIIRVFILVALVAPFIDSFDEKTPSNKRYFLNLLLVLLIYEGCRYYSMPYITDGYGEYLSLVGFYLIPYSLLFAFGLRFRRIDAKEIYRLLIFFIVCFLGLMILLWYQTGNFVQTQDYKYPPSIYYLSYALVVFSIIWVFSGKICKTIEKSKIINTIISFIAQNSIWIYLWHIPLLKLVNADFAVKYCVVLFVSTCIVVFQVWLVNSVLVRITSSTKVKKNLKILLTG